MDVNNITPRNLNLKQVQVSIYFHLLSLSLLVKLLSWSCELLYHQKTISHHHYDYCLHIVITPVIFIIIMIFCYYHCRRELMIKETNCWIAYFLLKKETSFTVNACALGF